MFKNRKCGSGDIVFDELAMVENFPHGDSGKIEQQKSKYSSRVEN